MKHKSICMYKNILKLVMLCICITIFASVCNNAYAEFVWQISEEEIETYNTGTPGNYPGGYAGENEYKYCFYYQYEKDSEIFEREIVLHSGKLNMTYDEFNKLDIETLIPKEDLYSNHLTSNEVYALVCKHIALKENRTAEEVSKLINSGMYKMQNCFAYIAVNVKLNREDSFLGSTFEKMRTDSLNDSWLRLGFDNGKITPQLKFIFDYEQVRLYDYRNYANVGAKNLETWGSKVKRYNLDFNSKIEFYDQTYDSTVYTLSKIVASSVDNPINMELIPRPRCNGEFVFRGWYTEKNGKGTQVLNENNQLSVYEDENGNEVKNYQIYSINNLKLYAYYLCKVTPYVTNEDGTTYRYRMNDSNFDFLVGYGMNLSDAYDPIISPSSPISIDGEVYKVWYDEAGNAIYTFTYAITKNQPIYIIKGKNDTANIKYMVINQAGEYIEYANVVQNLFTTLSSINVPALPEVAGYSSYGWMTEKNGAGASLSYNEIIEHDRIFYGYYVKDELINYEEPYIVFNVDSNDEWHNNDIEGTCKIIIPESFYVDGKLINTKTNETRNTKILVDSIESYSITADGATVVSKQNGEIKFRINKESLNAVNSWVINAEYKLKPSGKTKDIDIDTLSDDWTIENVSTISKTIKGVSKVLRLDKTIPEYICNVTDNGNNTVRIHVEVKDALSGIEKAYVKIDNGIEQDITDTLVFNRVGSILTSHTIEIYAIDKAGNVLTANYTEEVDSTAPIVKYGFLTNKVAENKLSSKNRFEASQDKAEYYLYVTDNIAGGVTSGIKEVRYQIVNEDGLVDGISIKETGKILNTFDKFVKLDIPAEYLRSGKETYLVIYAVDNAGNETYTLKSNIVYPNEFSKNALMDDGTNPKKRGFVGPNKYYDADILMREIPTAKLFINRANISAPLRITSAYDVKWSNTIKGGISADQFPVYKNEYNDTIGLGYRVDFAYNQIGYGSDNDDVTTVLINIYGRVGNTYKKLYVYEKGTGATFNKANLSGEYYIRNYVKRDNNIFNGNETNVQFGKGEYELIDEDNSILYFNYYIPANAKFKYDNNGTEVDYNGNEILISLDILSRKYMDLEDDTLYRLYDDNYFNYTSNDSVSYGIRKRAEGINEIQTFWYDLSITALDDISGGR